MKLDELKQTFFDECDEALQQIETGLVAIREGEQTVETIHAIFRAVHSVKGGAGIFGFQELVEFAHAFETVLDLLRHNKIQQSDATLMAMLAANDVLFDLIQLSRGGEKVPKNYGIESRSTLTAIAGTGSDSAGEEIAPADFDDIQFTPVMAEIDCLEHGERDIAVEIYPKAGAVVSQILEAVAIARTAGAILEPNLARLPSIQEIECGRSYLSWSGTLRTTLSPAAIHDLFGSVSHSVDVEVKDSSEQTEEAYERSKPADTFEAGSQSIPQSSDAGEPSNPIAVVAPAMETKVSRQAATTTRIELEKIDRAVNLVGELVIAQAMLGQIVAELPEQTSNRLMQTVQEVIHHTRELKDSVMSMRAQAVSSVFQRMPRLVRELSVKTGKKVRLELIGEKTEVDRSIIERLSDPLTHIIRNSVDHGIELPEHRISCGKDETGTVRLSAEHRGGRIVIEIRDDGAGINTDRVLKKAVERGLVKPNSGLSEDEINSLIMLPGFSTAESISDISGRGVGMDVVRASIAEIGGRVSLRSERGMGMTIQLSLPLTLAVMDGMVIKVRDEIYVMPLSAIVECLLPERAVIADLVGTHGVLQLRGEHIPLLRLADLFGLSSASLSNEEQVVIVSDLGDGRRVGLVVDELCGHQQVVIKSIEESYGAVPGIAAATILGNGRVAFILDVEKLPGILSDAPFDTKQQHAA